MKCPDCGNRLFLIHRGEYHCGNEECPANKQRLFRSAYVEYYGDNQEEINKQKRVK
jgi:hypothetical protein